MSSQLSIAAIKQQMKCAGCSKEACADLTLKSCGACYSVSYCSSDCQKAGWKTHRAECNQKKLCAACGKKASADLIMKSCSACHSVSYCGSDCQTAAWKEHRAACINQYGAKGGSSVGVVGSAPPTALHSSTVKQCAEADCFNACFDGRLEDLLKVLELPGVDINCAHPDNGATAVFVAAQNGHVKCLAELIRHGGADLSKMNNDGWAPIHAACSEGRVACISLLLDNGINADVRKGSVDGFTPVMVCCITGHVKCLALLLDRGSDPNLADSNGMTPVHIACTYGQLKCLQLLIARGANFNALDSRGNTPFDVARVLGSVDCVELLKENHALGKRAEDFPPISEAHKKKIAERQKRCEASKEDAKRCDYPPCNASAADKKLTALMKCPRCGEGRYCCHMHGNLDWDRHKLLCKDIKLKVEIAAQH